MTFFLGTKGNVRLRRATSVLISPLVDQIDPSDVNTILNRLSFDAAGDNLLTGDRVDISTTDARGLICFTAAAWSSAAVESSISAYVNVNAAGGLRFFPSFTDAVNNTRANELALFAFTGAPLPIECRVRDVSYNVLGNVVDYTLATDREAIDTTTLTDKFRQLYSAGLLSGSGTITCAFDYTTAGVAETPLLMLQLIQRLELGSSFDCALYLTDRSNDASVTNVFYQFDAMVTKAGVEVRAGDIINCTIDFVTTGEIKLLIGSIEDYILKEDDDRISLEQQSLEFLLMESED
jgi:hypothetical protein